jgi:hypothetical protein
VSEQRSPRVKDPEMDPDVRRVYEIVCEHLWFAEAHPEAVAESAKRLGVSTQSALALVIADQVGEEFRLTSK